VPSFADVMGLDEWEGVTGIDIHDPRIDAIIGFLSKQSLIDWTK